MVQDRNMTMMNANKMGKRRTFIDRPGTMQSKLSTISREQGGTQVRKGTLAALGTIRRKSTTARRSVRGGTQTAKTGSTFNDMADEELGDLNEEEWVKNARIKTLREETKVNKKDAKLSNGMHT